MDKKKIQLIEGSRYRIISLESKDRPLISKGIFKGYTIIGNVDAICLELDESHMELRGKMRIIPSHMVLCIDVISEVEEKKEEDEEVTSRYFG